MKNNAKVENAKRRGNGGSFGRGGARFGVCTCLAAAAVVAAFFYYLPDEKFEPLPQGGFRAFAEVRTDEKSAKAADFVGVEELSDFAPIFLPTRWNYRNSGDGGDTDKFAELRPEYPEYAEEIGEVGRHSAIGNPELEKTALARSIINRGFSGFSPTPVADSRAAAKTAASEIRIINTQTGEAVADISAEPLRSGDILAPAEFLLEVYADGMSGRPMVVNSSGTDRGDSQILDFIAKLGIFGKLRAGQYKILFSF